LRNALEAYPLTRYGYLKGRIDRIAADAVTDERRDLKTRNRTCVESQTLVQSCGNQSGSGGGASDASTGRALSLSPGIAASVEIATGDRRIIDFVLSPIAKAASEAGKER
jgi:hemolysin D